MARIKKVLRMENKGSYANVIVQLEDGSECRCYVGGECEVYFDHGVIKAFVKKNKIDKQRHDVVV